MAITRVRAENILDSDFKNSCRATSFTNITLNGSAPNTIDGITLAVNDRILVQGQTTQSQNGIYYVSTVGSGSNGTWTRSTDATQPYSITTGLLVYVNEGTNYGQRFYYVTTLGNIIVGTSSINFANLGSNFSNVTATNLTANTAIYSAAYYYSNGLAFSGGSTYGNSNVAAYLPTYSGNISAGNVTVNGNLFVTGNITTQNYETITQTEYANSIIASGNITAGGFNWSNGNAYGGYFTVSEINAANAYSNVLTNITTLQFDTATGFHVYPWGNNTAKIALGSSFSTWYVAGQGNLKAVGEDTAQFIAGSGISITTNNTATPQSITFSSTYSNSNVAAYLPTYTGTLSPSSLTTNSGGQITGYLTGAIGANSANSGAFTTITSTSTITAQGTIAAPTINAGTIGNSGATLTGTLSTAAQTNITSVGTLTGLTSTGTVAAPTVIGGTIGNAGAVFYGTLNSQSASQTNITSVGTLTGLTTSGNISAQTANIYAANLIGNTAIYGAAFYFANGTPFTSSSYGNTQVAAYLPTYTGNIGSGNISTGAVYINSPVGNYNVLNISGAALAPYGTPQTWKFFTNNTALGGSPSFILFPDSSTQTTAYPGTSTTLSLSGTISASTINAGTIGNTGAAIIGTLSTNAQPYITSVGTLTSLNVSSAVNGNAFNGVAVYAGTIGNTGSLLTGTLSTNSQTNITSIGILTGLTTSGNIAAQTANVYAASVVGNTALYGAQYYFTNGATLASTITGTYSNSNVTAYLPTYSGTLSPSSLTTNSGGQIVAYLTGAIGANTANSGTFTTATVTNATNTSGLGTGAFVVTQGGAAIQQDLYVGGNIYAANIISQTSQQLVVSDPLIYMSANAGSYNYEVGFYSHFVGGNVPQYAHTGFVRNHVDNQWYLFSNLPEPTGGVVNVANTNIVYDTLKFGAALIQNTTTSTSTTSGALQVAGGVGIAGALYTGGNLVILGNSYIGPVPTTFNYSAAPLNLTNSLAGALKTQLNLINTGGGAGAGSAIDFYTYTSVAGGSNPETRISTTDDGNYSGYIGFWTKTPGNSGANSLVERLRVDSAGNVVVFQTTTSTSTTTGALVVNGGVGVAGALYANNFNGVSLYAGTIGNTGAILTGTLSTAAQTNITSLGTLTGLTVSGTTNLQGTTNGATINATTVQGGTIGNSGATFTGATQTLTSTSQAASFTTSGGGQLTGYHTGAIGANSANSGAFTTLTASGNTTLNNYANIYIATGSASQTSALTVVGNVYGQGGIGYLDFLKLQNTYSAATNPNKFLRLDNAGTIQIINSAYSNNIFNLTDAGDLTVPGKLTMSTGVFWSNGAAYSSGGSSSPGGSSTQIQFNSGGSFGGATYLQYNITSGNLVSNSTTTSTSTTTGALVISGGVGIGGNINGGSNGTSTAQHNLLSGAQNAPTAGSILVGAQTVFSGAGSNYLTHGQYPTGSTINTIGVGFGQWLQSGYSGNATYYPIILNPLGGTVVVGSGTNSTSTTSGALAVYGGIGVSGNLYVGGNLSIAGNTTFINTQTITTTDTIAAPIISANVVGNVGSSHYGTIATNAQPFITSVGTLTGLISSANINAQTANVYAAYVVANSGIQGTLITNAQTNITSVGTLTSLTTSGNITAQTANIYAGNIISNTALITTSTTASNSTTTGALLVSGGAGVGANVYVGGNIYTQQRTGYTYNGNNTSVAYTYYNATTNSIDTVFG